MPGNKTLILLILSLSALSPIPGLAQAISRNLGYHTNQGLKINVHGGTLSVNGKNLYKLASDDIIYSSKRNQLIENGGSVFLFLEIDGRPNLDRLYVFKITSNKIDSITDVISSDLRDLDGDTYLEFGGRDLTEIYPSEDSMYYIPSEYYEIRNGRVVFDSAFTEETDLRINGVYLRNPVDVDASCCKVIVKPGKAKISHFPLVHPLILSERTDGPANVRDTINGKVLFSLYSNIPVYTSDTTNKWYRIALSIDLPEWEVKSHLIPREVLLYSSGVEVGRAISDIKLYAEDIHNDHGKITTELMGYTSMQNIKPQTLPENILSRLIDEHATITIALLKDFLKGFQFSRSKMGSYTTYQLDASLVYGPSAPLRLLLAFNKDTLFGVVHSRKLGQLTGNEYKVHRGYILSGIGERDPVLISTFTHLFNTFIDRAD